MATYYVEHDGKEWGPIEADEVDVESLLVKNSGGYGDYRHRLVFRQDEKIVAEYPEQYGYRITQQEGSNG